MVDALREARAVLRRGGCVVDIQPHPSHHPRLSVRDARGRVDLGAVVREPDPNVMAGHATREEAVALRLFRLARVGQPVFHARFSTLAAFDAEVASGGDWRPPRGWRARLERARRDRRGEAAIVVRERMSVAVLLKI